MVAGTGSGSGKTSLTCGLMRALKNKGHHVAAFKCGPDYIDPMFHEAVLGEPSSNLDMFLCGKDGVLSILGNKGKGKLSVIEGVMGFYDGLGGVSADYSSHDLSRLTKTPVILTVGVRGKSLSLAAEIKGFLDFMPNNIKGVIFNGLSPLLEPMYRGIIENHTDTKVYGFLPKIDGIEFKSRHLGLVTAGEIDDIYEKMEILGQNAEKYLDLDGIIALAKASEDLELSEIKVKNMGSCRIGVARDEAFCFYYRENLEILEKCGAQLVYFSPLHDEYLPENLSGLIFGGGYPELYLERLSGNHSMIKSVKDAGISGMPILAECGGFMYLMDEIVDGGMNYPFCGVLQGESFMTDRLSRFGYITLTAKTDTLLFPKGAQVNAHEFHYSDSSSNGDAFSAIKARGGKAWECVRAEGNVFAGYPHIHFYGYPAAAENFVGACLRYHKAKGL